MRTSLGDYRSTFWIIGTLCFLTGFAFLFCKKALRRTGELSTPTLVSA
jgi:hypothetical protein